jgi:hypothetical protein
MSTVLLLVRLNVRKMKHAGGKLVEPLLSPCSFFYSPVLGANRKYLLRLMIENPPFLTNKKSQFVSHCKTNANIIGA